MFFDFLSSFFYKKPQTHLMDFMPNVRGELKKDFPLAKQTWFGVGGPAEVFFIPKDKDDLAFFLSSIQNIPLTILGCGSNVLIRDGGIPGVVIKLGKEFSYIKVDGNDIICGAATRNGEIAKTALDAGLTGLEFLTGIPGNIGGSTKMNAGANGSDISKIIKSAVMIDNFGIQHILGKDDFIFNYRDTTIPIGWIFTEITLTGIPEEKTKIAETMNNIRAQRLETQPTNVKTAGSTFRNPEGLSAWKLIDKAGCRGLRLGGAMVSEKHCNFIINTGNATANDIEQLGENIRLKVMETCGIDLKWEIRKMGVKAPAQSSFGGR